MNKKVLKVMLGLTFAFILTDYVLKLFFPEKFVLLLTNEQLIAFGNYVDKHVYVHMLLGTVTSFITYFLYLGATTQQYTPKWYIYLLIVLVSASSQFLYYFVDTTLCCVLNTSAMLILPMLSKATLKDTAIVYITHYCAQYFSLKIRDLPMLLPTVNYATTLVLTAECYFWLLLFYLYNNFKKEENV